MNVKRFFMAQLNPCVGDLPGNVRLIQSALGRARDGAFDAAVLPEMAVPGYPAEDLLLKPSFVRACVDATLSLAVHTRGLLAVVGSLEVSGGRLFNAAYVFRNGRLDGIYRKMCLPNYGVFDEARYFSPGPKPLIVSLDGLTLGISICEDLWLADGPYARALSAVRRPDSFINLSASPYERGKQGVRQRVMRHWPARFGAPVFYCNLVGGQDELVFDGQSFVLDGLGRLAAQAPAFREADLAVEWPLKPSSVKPRRADSDTEVYEALVLGVRDYVEKNGFSKVLIGLSGGIDSALVAAIAVDALGAGRVVGVTMPSAVTSRATLSDAHRLARGLGIRMLDLPIRRLYLEYTRALSGPFKGLTPSTAEENIQARVRGTLLMALSNKFGWLVLTTGNKSETATGYCTLYGDMAGGFAVIKDVPKTLVYRLAHGVNRRAGRQRIPSSIIRRAPTAELRRGQKDQDTLPPYPKLDRFIEAYVDGDAGAEQAGSRAGLSRERARQTARMIDGNEYKRRQAPPGIKITAKAFGRDRRMPITNRFKT